jgi:translocator protein
MNDDPLLADTPAAMRARHTGGTQALEGASCIEGEGRPPSRPVAASIALACVAMTSIWGFVFIDPDMPRLDPVIDYAWYIPTSPLFATVWLALILCMAASFYIVLRSPESSARSVAITAFIAQFILKSLWAWLLFGPRLPAAALYVMILFVICVIVSLWFSLRVDRRAVLLMAPYLAWVAFTLMATIRIARG